MSDIDQSGQPQPRTSPPRGQQFSDPQCDVVWAAVQALDEASKHELLHRLGGHVAVSEDRDGPHAVRKARAVAALREAHSIHARESGDRSLPVAVFRALRSQYSECGWPPDGSIRRWMGGNWNDALRQAGLEADPEADVSVKPLGGALTRDEAVTAVRACAEDMGEVPSFTMYRHWASRPDVIQAQGRIPKSQPVFDRLWPGGGGWASCLREAGLMPSDGETAEPERSSSSSSGVSQESQEASSTLREGMAKTYALRPSAYRYQPEQIKAALRAAAEGREDPLRSTHYANWRAEQLAANPSRPLPTYSVIIRVLGPTWDEALQTAGLPSTEITPRAGRVVPERTAKPRYTDRQVGEALNYAHEQLGDPFTSSAYKRWRDQQSELGTDDSGEAGSADCPAVASRRVFPDFGTLCRRYGSWEETVARFVPHAATRKPLHEQFAAQEQRAAHEDVEARRNVIDAVPDLPEQRHGGRE